MPYASGSFQIVNGCTTVPSAMADPRRRIVITVYVLGLLGISRKIPNADARVPFQPCPYGIYGE
jgi:hypothetical protein